LEALDPTERCQPSRNNRALLPLHQFVVPPAPAIERRHGRNDAPLADFHVPPQPAVLHIGGQDEILAPRNDARGEPAQKFMRAIDDGIGTKYNRPFEIILSLYVSHV